MRARLHYLTTMIILPVYGIQVCPFIESLSPAQVALPIVVMLSLQYWARGVLLAKLVTPAPLKLWSRRAFRLEMSLFILSAAILMVYNKILHGFPLESGLKVLVGVSALGFFAAVDLALAREREVARRVASSGQHLDPDEDYFSLTSKVALFAAISVTLVIGVFMLLVNKDLSWLVEVGDSLSLNEARVSIIKEFLFVFMVILPHTLNIIYSYARNLRGFFDAENGVLKCVTEGDYCGCVPVGSNDEFGVMAKRTNVMVDKIRRRTEEIKQTRDVTIHTLASLAETRDNETGAHLLRTQRYVRALGRRLKDHARFAHALDDEAIELLYKSAPLHDIGKVGVPDAILLKPGKLTGDEFEIMKTHAQLGADAMKVAEKELGSNDFLRFGREIATTHHEKWDGSGYPGGLKGDAIPVSGRLMAVADVYDALISKRVYKEAFSHEKAMGIIIKGKGAHFDPDVIEAFVQCEGEFKEIAREYSDAAYGVAA